MKKRSDEMVLTSDIVRGHTDAIILSLLMKKDDYGYNINKHITDISQGELELKEATLYTAFKRLEESGFIKSYWGDEDSGARRKYYKITDSGRLEYEKQLAYWNRTRDIIDKLVN